MTISWQFWTEKGKTIIPYHIERFKFEELPNDTHTSSENWYFWQLNGKMLLVEFFFPPSKGTWRKLSPPSFYLPFNSFHSFSSHKKLSHSHTCSALFTSRVRCADCYDNIRLELTFFPWKRKGKFYSKGKRVSRVQREYLWTEEGSRGKFSRDDNADGDDKAAAHTFISCSIYSIIVKFSVHVELCDVKK